MTDPDDLKAALDGEAQNGQLMFHPVKEQRREAWWPANDAAELLIHVAHIYEDIGAVAAIRLRATDEYERRLLLKYLVIEVVSLVEHVDRLRTIVMKTEVFEPPSRPQWFGLTTSEHAQATALFKVYQAEKRTVIDTIRQIRRKIAAHRDRESWLDNLHLWNELGALDLEPLLESVRQAFEHVKELDIFSWAREPREGAIQVTGARLIL